MKTQLKNMKSELKALAQQIKEKRLSFKQAQRTLDWKAQWNLNPQYDAYQFRHKHIAYCLLRGRTMQEIEKGGSRPYNSPDMNLVERIMKKVQDEAICSSKVGSVEVSASSTGGTCDGGTVVVGTSAKDEQAVGQPDACVPESTRPGILDRVKSLFG